jgi:competence protein ComEA
VTPVNQAGTAVRHVVMRNRSEFLRLILVFFIGVIFTGVVVIAAKYPYGTPLQVLPPSPPPVPGTVYVGGEVNAPGFYPLRPGDTLESIIGAAGGKIDGAAPERLSLRVGGEDGEKAQKVNINTADSWLLEALPGIGAVRARAIIEYREQYGIFRDTAEIIKVDGIGAETYREIEPLITAAE